MAQLQELRLIIHLGEMDFQCLGKTSRGVRLRDRLSIDWGWKLGPRREKKPFGLKMVGAEKAAKITRKQEKRR